MTQITGPSRLTNKWLVLVLLLGIALINYGDRYLLAGLVEPIKADFGVSDGFMGLLMGPAFALLYSLLSIPLARLADKRSRIAILCAGCLVWSGFTILSGLAPSAAWLAVARIGVGVGEAAFQAPAYSLLAAYFAPEQRGRAFAVMTLAVYFGQYLGYRAGPEIAHAASWHAAFYVMGLAGVALAAIAFALIREPQRSDPTPAQPDLLWPLFKTLWRARSFRGLSLGMAFATLSGLSFGMWGPALFARAYALPITEANAAFGLAFGLPGLIGTLVFGVVVDRLVRTRGPQWLLMLAAAAACSATLLLLLVIWAPDVATARMIAIPSGLLGGGWSVGIMAALQYLMPDRVRATGTALALLIINLIGYVTGPLLAGQISDLVAGDPAHALRMGLTIIVPTGFLGAALMLGGARTLMQDRDQLAEGLAA
ncbi:MAG: MFS transporter [Alphaproteobacteria bacterium]|nr:MFS transporter [Alphaproteobacteria bacterium]